MSKDNENELSGSFPVSIIMERREVQHGPWTLPQWDVVGVVAGENIGDDERRHRVIRVGDGREQHLWSGFSVRLYKDSADSYWHNLVGKTPSLFVICQEDEKTGMAPTLVSANYDEAGAFMEADGTVFSTEMPAEVYQWIERYVVENYVPQEPRKRRRVNWSKENASDDGSKSEA